jgi:protein gp37
MEPLTGCSHVDGDCRNCYAETDSHRRQDTTKPWTAGNASENVVCRYKRLYAPYDWKEPTRCFVNSMSDLFHEMVPDAFIARVFDVMNDLPEHTFQILTKRPERAAGWPGPWGPNIWMGTSVGHARAKYRIDALRLCQAKTLFISAEPLWERLEELDLTGYHWVIVGGESGPGRRPMDQQWAREIRDECVARGIAFFFKQDSAYRSETRPYLVEPDGTCRQWQQYPDDLREPTLVTPEVHPLPEVVA